MRARAPQIAALAAAAALPCLSGCTSAQYAEVQAARDAHGECVELRGADDERCVALRERLQAEERRYRERAGGAAGLGCSPSDPACTDKF